MCRIFFTSLILFFLTLSTGFAQINLSNGQVFRYLKGVNASSLSSDWVKYNLDVSSWQKGTAPFRYGDGMGGTVLSDMQNSYTTVYLKSTFSASNVINLSKIIFSVNYDDGFIIWVNGDEVLSVNAPTNPSYNSTATSGHESGSFVEFSVDSSDINLLEGTNSISIQGFNVLSNSSDFYFDLSISAEPELPEYNYDTTVVFSHEAGFYSATFGMTIESPLPDYTLLYTIDGSDPQTSASAISAITTQTITIDPDINTSRGVTPAFILRASLVKEGFKPSKSVTKTYLFINRVKDQGYPGYQWPNSRVNGQVLDYEMAQDVTENATYSSDIPNALLQIPSISISTDLKNLFDSGAGIYVNSEQKGLEWERPCSFEIINPDGSEGLQVNAGLRIRGGNSAKNKNNPKHAFRLFFRTEYGPGKLKYPLFGDEGTDGFDAIDLRCEQNYSWSMDGGSNNTMVKDIFCRDLQGKMGQPNKKGRYYHLYLNGMYWGIFQTDERAEASFAESYFGGDKEDYDVVKVNTQPWPYYCEATDGNLDAWSALWQLCRTGFTQNINYFKVQGKNGDGIPNAELTTYVDIDNLIDYMMVIFYSGNFDAPVSRWYSNDMPNNFYAIYNRKNKSEGFKFLAHDSEHSMFVKAIYGDGITENRVNLGSNGSMYITNDLDFNPQWLHYKLSQNTEYKVKFSDRASELLTSGGLLSPDSAKALFKKRVDQIDMAVIAESARWGDAQENASRTKNDDWLPIINKMYNSFFPQRTDIVIQQLKDEGLLSNYLAPDVYIAGRKVLGSTSNVNGNTSVTIKNPNNNGTIYYTLDNSDPRKIGGSISENASVGNQQIAVEVSNTIIIMSRIKNGSIWGPLRRVLLNNESEDFSNLKVTELHYHPEDVINGIDTTSGKKFEFIELKNTGDHTLNLSGLTFSSGINYTFPDLAVLDPNNFYVLASKPNYFFERYGIYPSGNFKGQLGNGGELIELASVKSNPIISFTYDDAFPWPFEPDGDGYTLTSALIDPTGDPNNHEYWTSSSLINGTPFADDLHSNIGNPHASILNITVSPNPSSRFVSIHISGESVESMIQIKVYSSTGVLVFRDQILNNSRVDFLENGLNPGIYIIKIEFNNSSYTEKLILVP